MQFLPHLKDSLVALVSLSVRILDLRLRKMSLRLSIRRKATRGVPFLKTLLYRGQEERVLRCLRCLCMIVDMEQRAGLYVVTSGTRLGWFVVV